MPILRDSGWSQENYQQIIKIFKIDHLGGPRENPRKIVLGRLNNCQKIINILSRDILFCNIFDRNMVAACGRCQKRGGGLRPPPLFWVHISSGIPEFRKSGIPENRNSGYPEIRDFRNSGSFGNPGFRISGNPDFRKSGIA